MKSSIKKYTKGWMKYGLDNTNIVIDYSVRSICHRYSRNVLDDTDFDEGDL